MFILKVFNKEIQVGIYFLHFFNNNFTGIVNNIFVIISTYSNLCKPLG